MVITTMVEDKCWEVEPGDDVPDGDDVEPPDRDEGEEIELEDGEDDGRLLGVVVGRGLEDGLGDGEGEGDGVGEVDGSDEVGVGLGVGVTWSGAVDPPGVMSWAEVGFKVSAMSSRMSRHRLRKVLAITR